MSRCMLSKDQEADHADDIPLGNGRFGLQRVPHEALRIRNRRSKAQGIVLGCSGL